MCNKLENNQKQGMHGRFQDPFLFLPNPESVPMVWLYGPYEYEAFRLSQMIREKNLAKLRVVYPGDFHQVSPEIYFRAVLERGDHRFTVVGVPEVRLDGVKQTVKLENGVFLLNLPHRTNTEIKLCVADLETDIPTLCCMDEVASEWLCSVSPDGPWGKPYERTGISVPHRTCLVHKNIIPKKIDEQHWDAGFELLGTVKIQSLKKPELFVGESLYEMENEDPVGFEQTLELKEEGPGAWSSIVPLALRYIRLKNASPDAKVTINALYRNEEKCGDCVLEHPIMQEIFDKSVYTLHLCMNHFFVDAIKRDRMPWEGDLTISLLSNAYTFGDAEITRDTLAVLESAGIQKQDINGIAEYSLWLLINHDFYQLFFNDPSFLHREYPRLLETIEILLSRCDERGFLTDRCKWIFIDWLDMKKTTALQIIFYGALNASIRLANRMGDEKTAERCRQHAEKLSREIRKETFDQESGLFRSEPNGRVDSRHPNFYAILFGLTSKEENKRIAEYLSDPESLPSVGTTYTAVFEALALARAGFGSAAITEIETTWGGMLKFGETTFFEAYANHIQPIRNYEFYTRPFGLSLCHITSSGPAFLLPLLLSGLEPLSDGWKQFRVNPMIFPDMDFVVGVPTPFGRIEVRRSGKKIQVTAPPECCRVDGPTL